MKADRRNSFGLAFSAFRADAKQFHRMRHLAVTHPFCQLLQGSRRAQIERFDLRAGPADDVVVMFPGVQLVANRAVAEVASPHEIQVFEDGETAIHRHEVAGLFFDALVNLLDAKRSVVGREHRQDLATRPGNAIVAVAQGIERAFRAGGSLGHDR